MARVRAKHTRPELVVRRSVHALGGRYRLYVRGLPGSPDLANRSRRWAIFVHGCFWHGHDCPRGRRLPKTNVGYWTPKLTRNRERDAWALAELGALGWRTLVVWECETRDAARLIERLRCFLADVATAAPPAIRP